MWNFKIEIDLGTTRPAAACMDEIADYLEQVASDLRDGMMDGTIYDKFKRDVGTFYLTRMDKV